MSTKTHKHFFSEVTPDWDGLPTEKLLGIIETKFYKACGLPITSSNSVMDETS